MQSYLRPEVIVWLETEHLHGCDVEMKQDVLERRSVSWLGRPALLDEQFETVRAGGRNGQLQRVAADAPDDGGAVHVAVGNLARQQLPQAHTKGPDVHLCATNDDVCTQVGQCLGHIDIIAVINDVTKESPNEQIEKLMQR